jgi:hypothetical protein
MVCRAIRFYVHHLSRDFGRRGSGQHGILYIVGVLILWLLYF